MWGFSLNVDCWHVVNKSVSESVHVHQFPFWLRPTNFCLVWLNFSFTVYIHFQKLSESLALRVLKLNGKSERGSKRSTDQAIYIISMRENLVWMFSSDWFVWSVSIRKFDRKLSKRLSGLRLWISRLYTYSLNLQSILIFTPSYLPALSSSEWRKDTRPVLSTVVFPDMTASASTSWMKTYWGREGGLRPLAWLRAVTTQLTRFRSRLWPRWCSMVHTDM